ncbi:MAG: nucleoside triphosphate pyrophosphohydrolase [Myxococcota bacterium]
MSEINRLLDIMARLRDPDGGCPWDLEQSFESVAPHTLEEAYEVDYAIASGDMAGLREELGDLLLQVVFHARMAEEAGHFDFGDVVEGLCDKLVRRHPHVFGDARVDSAEEQTRIWEAFKAQERKAGAGAGEITSLLDGIPLALPALARAAKLQRRAARAALDDVPESEEKRGYRELLDALRDGGPSGASDDVGPPVELTSQLGPLLFACTRWAVRLGADPEQALRAVNRDYELRVRQRESG